MPCTKGVVSLSGLIFPGPLRAEDGLVVGVWRVPNFLLNIGLFLMLSTAPDAAFLTASILKNL